MINFITTALNAIIDQLLPGGHVEQLLCQNISSRVPESARFMHLHQYETGCADFYHLFYTQLSYWLNIFCFHIRRIYYLCAIVYPIRAKPNMLLIYGPTIFIYFPLFQASIGGHKLRYCCPIFVFVTAGKRIYQSVADKATDW